MLIVHDEFRQKFISCRSGVHVIVLAPLRRALGTHLPLDPIRWLAKVTWRVIKLENGRQGHGSCGDTVNPVLFEPV